MDDQEGAVRLCGKCGSRDRYATGACRICARARAAAWQRDNLEASREHKKLWQRAHKESSRAADVRYRERHPEKVRAAKQLRAQSPAAKERKRRRDARYYTKHREERQTYIKAWQSAHPEVGRANAKRRRAQKRGAGVLKLTLAEWLEILEYFGYACAYCSRTDLPLEQDHITAISRGGEHTKENVIPACKRCNRTKSNKPIFMMANDAA